MAQKSADARYRYRTVIPDLTLLTPEPTCLIPDRMIPGVGSRILLKRGLSVGMNPYGKGRMGGGGGGGVRISHFLYLVLPAHCLFLSGSCLCVFSLLQNIVQCCKIHFLFLLNPPPWVSRLLPSLLPSPVHFAPHYSRIPDPLSPSTMGDQGVCSVAAKLL